MRVSVRGYETDSQGHLNGSVYLHRMEQEVRRVDDGGVAARVTAVGGLMELEARRLVGDPVGYFRALGL